MPPMSTEEVLDARVPALRKRIANATRKRLCTRYTDIVIEGSPRSSNTFTLDILNVLQTEGMPRLKVTHHTHGVENILIALRLVKLAVADYLAASPKLEALDSDIFSSEGVL